MATRSCSAARPPTSPRRCSRTGRSSTRSRTWSRFPASQLPPSRWRSIRPCRPITSKSWSGQSGQAVLWLRRNGLAQSPHRRSVQVARRPPGSHPRALPRRRAGDREQGLTDLVAPNFVGVFAPAGTPKPIIDQVAQANLALLADHDYRQLLISGTFEPHGDLDPQAYRRYAENELARWSPIVKTLGLKID